MVADAALDKHDGPLTSAALTAASQQVHILLFQLQHFCEAVK